MMNSTLRKDFPENIKLPLPLVGEVSANFCG
jgi:hypothetical protein